MKIFVHILLILGLIDPGVSLAKSKVEAKKSDIGTEILDTTDGDELTEKKNNKKALNKALFGAGLFAAAIIAGIFYFQAPVDFGAAQAGTRIMDTLNLTQ
ncbi:MAG: hypothetical protein AB8G05_17205 [Oligoflexales bacterium]